MIPGRSTAVWRVMQRIADDPDLFYSLDIMDEAAYRAKWNMLLMEHAGPADLHDIPAIQDIRELPGNEVFQFDPRVHGGEVDVSFMRECG